MWPPQRCVTVVIPPSEGASADESRAGSSQGGGQVFAQVVESVLEFVKGHVEGRNRVEATVGFVGEHVGTFDGFEGNGIIKSRFTTGPIAHLVKGLLKVHHVVDVGQFLVLSEELGVDGRAVRGGQAEVEENTGLLWLVENGNAMRAEAHCSHGRPLGVVSAATDHGKGIEFENIPARIFQSRGLTLTALTLTLISP